MYKVDSQFNAELYFNNALKKLDEFNIAKDNLYYIALDYRFCVERLLFEYLALVKNSQVSKTLQKLYKASDLARAILKAEPNFFKKIEFVNIYLEVFGIKEKVIPPDLEKLTKIYSGLNNYLHAPKMIDQSIADTKALSKFIDLIDFATVTLRELLSHPRGYIQLNEKGLEIFNDFINEKITKDELVNKIKEELDNYYKKSP